MKKLLVILLIIATLLFVFKIGFAGGVQSERNRIWNKLEMCV